MKPKIKVRNGDNAKEGLFIIDGITYTFPFTSSAYRRERIYIKGKNIHVSSGIIGLSPCLEIGNVRKALKNLGIKSEFQSTSRYEYSVAKYRKNIGELVRDSISPINDSIDAYAFREVKRRIPRGLIDFIRQTSFEFTVEPNIKLGDETFNHSYAVYDHKLIIKSPILFDAEVVLE
ncbi:MAG: hypothetical protein AABX79_03085 [Nanoarchaeota archaeon]